jgi:uncharacterized protein (TIGR03083 family)
VTDLEQPPRPREVAHVATRLRAQTTSLLARLTDDELALPALPDWDVADVLRHLATSDKAAVTGRLAPTLLAGDDAHELEPVNDELVAAARDLDRETLLRELERWGRRLFRAVALLPPPLAGTLVPSAFGRVPLLWVATNRVYDEWVHQADIAAALGEPEPDMDADTRRVLAWFQRRALPTTALPSVPPQPGIVQLTVADAPGPVWLIDPASRRFGAHVRAIPDVALELSVAAWCLHAADRVPWRELESQGRIRIDGADRGAAERLLDAIRVV